MAGKWFAISVLLAPAVLLAVASPARADVVLGEVTGYAAGNFLYPTGPQAIRVVAGEEERSLASLMGSATLVIFTDEPCSKEIGRALASANWINEDIQVIVVGAGKANCDTLQDCILDSGQKAQRVTALCDPQGLIRKWCNVSAPGVVVLDRWGAVYDRGEMADFGFLRQQAEFLADGYKKPG